MSETIRGRLPHPPNGNRGEGCDQADADIRSLLDAIEQAGAILDRCVLTSEGQRARSVLAPFRGSPLPTKGAPTDG